MSQANDKLASTQASQEPRRRFMKKAGAIAGVAAVSQTEWAKPVINSVMLPAHAQTSTQTIAEIAVATPDLSTLVSLLTQGQVDALSGPGPLTVFAPTNAAFSAIQSTVDMLTPQQIEDIVNYHVLAGELPATSIPATTGDPANVIATVQAANGVVYVIDQVLLP